MNEPNTPPSRLETVFAHVVLLAIVLAMFAFVCLGLLADGILK